MYLAKYCSNPCLLTLWMLWEAPYFRIVWYNKSVFPVPTYVMVPNTMFINTFWHVEGKTILILLRFFPYIPLKHRLGIQRRCFCILRTSFLWYADTLQAVSAPRGTSATTGFSGTVVYCPPLLVLFYPDVILNYTQRTITLVMSMIQSNRFSAGRTATSAFIRRSMAPPTFWQRGLYLWPPIVCTEGQEKVRYPLCSVKAVKSKQKDFQCCLLPGITRGTSVPYIAIGCVERSPLSTPPASSGWDCFQAIVNLNLVMTSYMKG